jgi:hypothetical protein
LDFEEKVRQTACLLWNRSAEKERIAGVNYDCVLKMSAGRWTVVEATIEHNLEKVRSDINRLSMARNSLFSNQNIVSDCYLVLQKPPTPAMADAGKELHVKVVSFSRFEKQFFDYDSYKNARLKVQFGSSINVFTGAPDSSEYVPVAYVRQDGSKTDLTGLAKLIAKGKKIVLLGQYGAGKSRCVRELFAQLSDAADSEGDYYLAIDLRRAWGLQSASEIIRRHLEDIGFAESADRVMRAFNAGKVCALLDGFDELGSQTWSNNVIKLQNIRYETLTGVRELIQMNKGGLLICGREHYFNGNSDLFNALGINPQSAEIIRCKDEFSDEEMEAFLETLSIEVPVPEWLPKRPLMCQAIAALGADDILKMFEEDGGDIDFWHRFMQIVCSRESQIRSSLDADTIILVLQELSRMTRSKTSGVGPLSLSEIQRAFEAVLGREPVEGASVLLQRLPGLGRTEAESDDRKFIDIYIVDGLRALDVAKSIREDSKEATKEKWTNPLGELGIRVLAREIGANPTPQSALRFANYSISNSNTVLASDIVASLLHTGKGEIEYGGLALDEGHITQLDLSKATPRRLAITNSIVETIIFPSTPIDSLTISKCVITKAIGVSDRKGLPVWVSDSEVDSYDSLANLSSIKNVRLSIQHRILVAILKKTYFQKGRGRQEAALLRGLGQIDRHGYTSKILAYLVNNGILEKAKGDHGDIYVPVLKRKRRVGSMLSELNMSTDEIWSHVASL